MRKEHGEVRDGLVAGRRSAAAILKKRGDGHGGWIGRRLWLAACGWNLVTMRGWSGWKLEGEFGLGEESEVGGDKRSGGGLGDGWDTS